MTASWSAQLLLAAGLLGGDAGEAIVISVDPVPGVTRPVSSTDTEVIAEGDALASAVESTAASPTPAAAKPAASAPAASSVCTTCQDHHEVVQMHQVSSCTTCSAKCAHHHHPVCASSCESNGCCTCKAKKSHGFFAHIKGWFTFSHKKKSCACQCAAKSCTTCDTGVCSTCPTSTCSTCASSGCSTCASSGCSTCGKGAGGGQTHSQVIINGEPPITLPAGTSEPVLPGDTLRVLPAEPGPKTGPAPIPRTQPLQTTPTGAPGPTVSAPKRIEGKLNGIAVVKPHSFETILPQSQPVLPKKSEMERNPDEPNYASDYSWVEGTLQKVHVRGGAWVVRYLPLDKADKNGGSVVLARDARMDVFKEGDVIRVHGEILKEKPSASLGGAMYRVQRVTLVKNGEPSKF